MRIGFHKTDITPPLGAELAGYGYYLSRRATHVTDPLFARAMAFESENGRFILLSCDVLGLSRSVCDEVKRALWEDCALPKENVLTVSIHTHTAAPLVYHEGCGELCPEYIQTVAPRLISVCKDALGDLAEVTSMHFCMSPLSTPRVWNRACADGPVDENVRAFHIARAGAKDISLFSYACHAVCRGRSTGISADFPGQVCRLAEQSGRHAMYINGLCGDIDPIPRPENERESALNAFAEDIFTAAHKNKAVLPLSVSGMCARTHLRLMLPESESAIHKIAEDALQKPGMIPGADRVIRIWEAEMVKKLPSLTASEEVSVSCILLGGIPIAALPFEGFTQTGITIRKAIRDPRALILGCAEQLLGYLPTMDDIRRGSYAAYESTFLYKRLPVEPGEAERMGETIGQRLMYVK